MMLCTHMHCRLPFHTRTRKSSQGFAASKKNEETLTCASSGGGGGGLSHAARADHLEAMPFAVLFRHFVLHRIMLPRRQCVSALRRSDKSRRARICGCYQRVGHANNRNGGVAAAAHTPTGSGTDGGRELIVTRWADQCGVSEVPPSCTAPCHHASCRQSTEETANALPRRLCLVCGHESDTRERGRGVWQPSGCVCV
jgi:hypothetical protein